MRGAHYGSMMKTTRSSAHANLARSVSIVACRLRSLLEWFGRSSASRASFADSTPRIYEAVVPGIIHTMPRWITT